jgi:hypothetical protein
MQELSEYKQKVFNKARDDFQRMALNPLYVDWRNECIENNAFHDGKNQWPLTIVNKLKARGQDIVVLNKIKPMVNQICGLEVNTRTKFAYRSHSNNEEEELLAKALTHFGFYVQENQDFPYKGSLAFKDMLKGGIGWTHLYSYKGVTYYDYINSLNMVYDADDFSPQLTNQQSIANMRFLSNDQLNMLWPQYKKRFEEINPQQSVVIGNSGFSSELYNRQSAWLSTVMENLGLGNRYPVIEVQYREAKKYYCGIGKSGQYFSTFDEEKAEKLANSPNDIDEEMGTQIMRTVIYENLLLDHSPLYPNIPNMEDFSYFPRVWDRRSSDSIPVGWIEGLKDLQREINYRKAKELHALNSVRAVIDGEAYQGQSMEDIRNELTRPDGILFKSKGSTVDIIPNIDMAASHMRAAERNDHELQQVSGLFSDSLGEPTNATSGVAIKQRQIGTSKNLASGFDGNSIVKKREGKMLLNIIQGGDSENLFAKILDDDETQSLVLNLVREIDGEKVIFNDVRTLPVDVYIEQVPDYDSSPEEQQATLEALLNNPQGMMIMQNPELLKLLRFRDWEKIANSMQQIQQRQMAMEQQAQGNGQMQLQASSNENVGAMNPVSLGAI